MFNQQELQILLGGVNSPIDLDDLRTHAKYGGLYDDHEPTIQMFWRVMFFLCQHTPHISHYYVQVVKSFDQEHLRKLLRFVTSCSRPPLL